MPREPHPYVKDGYYRTSVGGVKHRILCKVQEGMKAAKLALAQLTVALNDKTKLPTNKTTVETLVTDFITFQKNEIAPSTLQWYKDKLTSFRERFSFTELTALTEEAGIQYKSWLINTKKWKRGNEIMSGLKPTTVNHCIRAAKTVLEWACKPSRQNKYGLAKNPWQEIGYLPEQGRERLLTEPEFQALLSECRDGAVSGSAKDFRDQLVVLRYTTMRPGELRALKWDYIHWDTHRIVFPSDVVKTRRRREVTLLEIVEATLKNRSRENGYVFSLPGDKDGKRTAGQSGNMISAQVLSRRFRRLVNRCIKKELIQELKSGERIVPYSTRHTRITEMFVQGNEHHIVMHDAGHVVPQTTERYKHLAGSFVADQIRQRSGYEEPKAENAG